VGAEVGVGANVGAAPVEVGAEVGVAIGADIGAAPEEEAVVHAVSFFEVAAAFARHALVFSSSAVAVRVGVGSRCHSPRPALPASTLRFGSVVALKGGNANKFCAAAALQGNAGRQVLVSEVDCLHCDSCGQLIMGRLKVCNAEPSV